MKWFRKRGMRMLMAGGALAAAFAWLAPARTPLLMKPGKDLKRWIENVPAGSEIEQALYRAMQLPGGEILFRRSPKETVPALTELQQREKDAALYSPRALEEEGNLDFAAAERDWKTWTEQASDKTEAQLELADFYERRLNSKGELTALETVGAAPPDARERWMAVENQRSWKAMERALKVVDEYALPHAEQAQIYAAWIKRYPREPEVYARQFAFLLEEKDFSGASQAIARYKETFPEDRVFPVKAEADLAVKRGQPRDGLAVYERQFEPLWPAELVKSYFALVIASRDQRAFADAIRAKLAADPDDMKDTARLFYLDQQQGQLDSAKAVLTHFREEKEARGAKWTAEELVTLETLFEAIQDFPEAARYAYALAADHTANDSEQKGVAALARILLTAPEQPLRMGAGNLALYKNIATMDPGPGYLNGILSLLLNTQGPSEEYANEDQLATPYFHRARAAQLLAEIDRRFPDEPARPQLHASLMEAYAAYGEDAAVIREGTGILAAFPKYGGRVNVALQLADAYERTKQTDKEFALYQDLLQELAAEADGVPLGEPGDAYSKPVGNEKATPAIPAAKPSDNATNAGDEANENAADGDNNQPAAAAAPVTAAVRSTEYNEVLNRYLERLVALQRLPDALTVLRGELDRNPQDPGLYTKLADFLEQNRLNAHEEEVYQRAIQQFQSTNWYAKLGRFYLRQRRNADYSALMHKVADIFSGTELEAYLGEAPAPNKVLALEVNRYANQKFPHDLAFVNRLLAEYEVAGNEEAREKLLWEHWTESADLRDQLFETLSKNGRLDATLAKLREQAPEIEKADWTGLAERNPAAGRLWLDACVWQSRFEQGVGAADALSAAYPADTVLGEQASSLHRSLAYFHPEDTDNAVAIEKRMLDADPGNLDTLARIGDIYADRGRMAEASPYWVKMAEVRPGVADGYLQSATVFWDYFDFAAAQEELEKGRARLNDPVLFGYQEGAIAESRGDLPAAVRAYAASAIAEEPSTESRDRLLALARRKELRAQVEAGTGELLKGNAPGSNAIQLRAGILEAEHRKDDLKRELEEVADRTGSFDVLDAISAAAGSHALPDVQETALRRQIVLTTDPVRSLQLQYQLVDLLGQRDTAAAAREEDAIYAAHENILGVVRATVDYDWAHDRKAQSVTVLTEAANVAYPELKNSFELEAARKLTDLGDYVRSREILTALEKDKPLDPGYEAAMADNLARANDTAGLAAFYLAQLDLVRKSALPHDEKQQRIGQLRRGMIAAATTLGKFTDAVDQYIELINAYPDDAALAQEAALYAVAHGARERLMGFYQKTIVDSPRDPRWSIVLARLATAAEDYPLAIDAYGKALKLRPERQDLYIAQAKLDEKIYGMDDAIALYRKLYTLTYRDPQWMEKVAELCARQGHAADAVSALETGWIQGKPAKAANSFAVAERLEKWGLLAEAQHYAELGVNQAGGDLLVTEQAGAATYARILARQRQCAAAFAKLIQAREQAPQVSMAAVAQQLVTQSGVTGEEWRKQREEQRREQAASGFAQAVKTMATAVGEFYTPEEKTEFALLLKQNANHADREELAAVYIPAAKAAELTELASEFQWSAALEAQAQGDYQVSDWLQLEKSRVEQAAAAAQLEKQIPRTASKHRAQAWEDVVKAYRDAGDTVSELRAMTQLATMRRLEDAEQARYYQLLLKQNPQELERLASSEDSAANYLVRNASTEQSLAGVTARSASMPPVWKDAYTGLTGLYFRAYRPDVDTAFANALDADRTIGERVAHPVDREHALAGDVWFYYGSRYAEYLDGEKNPRAEDYLESDLEHSPSSPAAYLQLADYSAATGRRESALTDYQHSLDLDPDQPGALDSIAMIEWDQGREDDAVAAWANAVKLLTEEMDARRVPETFWSDFARVLADVSAKGKFDTVRDSVDAMLRVYIARNGEYRTEPLLEAGYKANGNSVEWLLAITASASNQDAVLNSILPNRWSEQGNWIDKAQISRILEHIVALEEKKAEANAQEFDDSLDNARRRYVDALIDEKKYAEAGTVLAQVTETRRQSATWLPALLEVAAAQGTLDQMLASWRKQQDTAPADALLRAAVENLAEKDQRAVMRFVYERALERRELTAANFLGLAAIDLDEHDTTGAVELLKRMTLVSDNMYADADSAAKLLETHGKPQEALEFLKPLAAASPWNTDYKVRLAKAMLASDPKQADALGMLAAVAGDAKAEYRDREAAAAALKGHGAPASGSGELKLLSQGGCPPAEAAQKPLFVRAREAAAECSNAPKEKERLLHEALAAAPANGQLRLRYVWAAFAAGFDSRALVAADPILDPTNYGYGSGYPNGNAEQDDGAGEPTGDGARAVTLASLPEDDAARLVQLAAAAYERRRDYANASRILTYEKEIVRDPARKAEIVNKLDRLNEEIARAAENDRRAPQIHEPLDQSNLVRPRLLKDTPVPAQPAQENEQ